MEKLSPGSKCKEYTVEDVKFTHENFMQHEYMYEQLVKPGLIIIEDMENGIC